jgi:hypothetical protein
VIDKLPLHALHVFVRDRVQLLRSEHRDQVDSDDRFLADNAARLQAVCDGIAVQEPGCEFSKSWCLLSRFCGSMLEKVPLAIFSPSLGR